jgi:site-specific DNA-cytosine methylase
MAYDDLDTDLPDDDEGERAAISTSRRKRKVPYRNAVASDLSKFDFDSLAKELYGEVKPEVKPTKGSLLKDMAVSAASGAGSLVEGIGTLAGMATGDVEGNTIRQIGKRATEYWDAEKSDSLKADEAARAKAIAESDGELEKGWTAVKETLRNPALAATFFSSQLPQMVPGAVVGKALMVGSKVAGLGAKAAGVIGTAGSVGTGAALQGGDVAGDTYDDVRKIPQAVWDANPEYQALLAKGNTTPEQAKIAFALKAARESGAAGAALSVITNGLLPGGTAIERFLLGSVKEGVKGGLKAGVKAGLKEAGTEAIEEGGGKFGSNLAKREINPDQSLTEGMGENTAMGALGGFGMGGIAGLKGHNAEETATPPAATPAATPDPLQQAAAQSQTSVSPSTPEPAGDIAAQIAAVADPTSTKDAVFVAAGNQNAIPDQLPEGMIRVDREEGTFLTTNPQKANQFNAAPQLSDVDMAALLGYPEDKASAVSGNNPHVVQGRDAAGNVVAEAAASDAGTGATQAAIASQVPEGGTVEITTPEAVQAERAAGAELSGVAEAPATELDAGVEPAAAEVAEPVVEEPVAPAAPTQRVNLESTDQRYEALVQELENDLNRDAEVPVEIDHQSVGIVDTDGENADPVYSKLAAQLKKHLNIDLLVIDAPEGIKDVEGNGVMAWPEGMSLGGSRTIVLNRSAKQRAVMNVIGHELAHQLKTEYPEIWEKLAKVALRTANRKAAATHASNLFKAGEKRGHVIDEEIVSEIVGEQMGDPTFWQEVMKDEDESFVSAVTKIIGDILDKFTKAFTGAGFITATRDVQKIRAAIKTAFSEWEAAVAAKEKADAQAQAKGTEGQDSAQANAQAADRVDQQPQATAKEEAQTQPETKAEATQEATAVPEVSSKVGEAETKEQAATGPKVDKAAALILKKEFKYASDVIDAAVAENRLSAAEIRKLLKDGYTASSKTKGEAKRKAEKEANSIKNLEHDMELIQLRKEYDEKQAAAKAEREKRTPEEIAAEIKRMEKEGNPAPEQINNTGKPLKKDDKFQPWVQTPEQSPATDDIDMSKVPLNANPDDFRKIIDSKLELFKDPAHERKNLIPLAEKGPYISEDEAKKTIQSWKDEVKRQRTKYNRNYDKTIIVLFDYTGKMSEPWAEAGYTVLTFDLQDGVDVMDLSPEWFDEQGIDVGNVYGIIAMPPCTDFTNASSRFWKKKDKNGSTEASKALVTQTLSMIEHYEPKFWMIENPVGRIEEVTGLPQSRLMFDYSNFGTTSGKEEMLWGNFNNDMPLANVKRTKRKTDEVGGKSLKTKNARSATPEGFAYSFFMANNYENKDERERLVEEFPEAYGAIDEAIKAGVPMDRIRDTVESEYEYDNTQQARDALMELITDHQQEQQEALEEEQQVQADPKVAAMMDKLKEAAEQDARIKENSYGTADEPLKFISGMSAPKDFQKVLSENRNVGVSINYLSDKSMPKIAEALAATDNAHLFVDSGAFSMFMKNLRQGMKGLPVDEKPMDYDGVLSRYNKLLKAINDADDSGHTADRVFFVMPDVVGDQAASLELVGTYADVIKANGLRNIIPLQGGELSLKDAYETMMGNLGLDPKRDVSPVLGIPSKAAAVSNEEFLELMNAHGDRIGGVHILGALADKTLQPRLDQLKEAGYDINVSADANRLRSFLYGDTTRDEAMQKMVESVTPPKSTKEQLTAPAGNYHPQQKLELDGRKWVVTAVAHTGKEMTIKTNDGKAHREERVQIAQSGKEQISIADLIEQSDPLGKNAAGEKLYRNVRGRFRVRKDRADQPDGYADFGGDLAPFKKGGKVTKTATNAPATLGGRPRSPFDVIASQLESGPKLEAKKKVKEAEPVAEDDDLSEFDDDDYNDEPALRYARVAPEGDAFKKWFRESTIVSEGPTERELDDIAWYEELSAKNPDELTPADQGAFRALKDRIGILRAKASQPAGTPKVMYHGTAQDISEFRAQQAGAIFVTDDPVFAESFSNMSKFWMLDNIEKVLTPEAKEEALAAAEKRIRAKYKDQRRDLKEQLEFLMMSPMDADFYLEEAQKRMPSAENILPLYVRAERPFDYQDVDHVEELVATLFDRTPTFEQGDGQPALIMDGKRTLYTAAAVKYALHEGQWSLIETPEVQAAIKANGHDGFYVTEGGRKNLAVYRSEQLKSAVGNYGTFDPQNPDIRYARSNQLPAYTKKLKPEQLEAMRKLGNFPTKEPLKDRIHNVIRNGWARVQQGLFDQFAPLMKLGSREYMLARLTKGADAPLETLLSYGKVFLNSAGALDVQYEKGGLVKILQQLNGEHDMFFSWIAGNRAARLKAQGRENLLTNDDITALKDLNQGKMEDGKDRMPVYFKVLQEFNKYNKSVLDVAEKAGIINPDDRKTWESDFYVPFYRVSEDKEYKGGPANVSGLVFQQAFKKLKGGKNQTRDLLANVMMNWSHLLNASMRNQAAQAALEAAEKAGVATKLGYKATGSVWYMGEVIQKIPKGTAYMDGNVPKVSDGTAEIKMHGKVYYHVEDPLLMQALTAMEFAGWKNPAMKALQKAKHYLTAGVTISPAFKVNNLARDQVAAIAQNPISFQMHKNLIDGWKGTNKDSEQYARMLTGGGLMRMGTFLEDDRAAHVKMLVNKGVKDVTILDSTQKVNRMLSSAWDWWQEVGDRSENITRAAIYKQVYEKGIKDGKGKDLAHLEASFAARDSMDFGLQGSFPAVRFLTQIVPFLNARLQGLYKLGRDGIMPTSRMLAPQVFGRPSNTDKQKAMRFGAMVGAVALASIALMLHYEDDEDFKAREEWDRDAFWWFKVGDTAYRIPKPFELGAIGTLVERSLELARSDMNKDDRKRFTGSLSNMVKNTFNMDLTPQLIKPLHDLYANKDSFTQRPIETEGMQDRSKEFRIGQRTSATAQALGSVTAALGISPVQTDHLVKGYFGWLGTHLVMTADFAVRPMMGYPDEPARKFPNDYLLLGNFAGSLPADQTRYLTKFYEQAQEVQQTMGDIRYFQQQGNLIKARELMMENRDKVATHTIYSAVQKQLGEINKRIVSVRASDLPPEEKRAQIDRLVTNRNQLAKMVEDRRAASLK